MYLQRLVLSNFRCFGPGKNEVSFDPHVTCLIGGNGSGKTAAMYALLRLFGISSDQRQLRVHDFHVGHSMHNESARERTLSIEAWFAFPELTSDELPGTNSVSDFFRQMAFDDNGTMVCRFRLDGTWTDDGTVDGVIEPKYRVIRTTDDNFDEVGSTSDFRPVDRGRIQVVYVPALRDGTSQVAAFLRSRVWRSINWSEEVRKTLKASGGGLNSALTSESAVETIRGALLDRWKEVHTIGIFANPEFRPVNLQLEEFIRRVDVVFHPDEQKRERSVGELSDGQRSLFHLAMTAALLDVEHKAQLGEANGFKGVDLDSPDLTIIAVEEPENSLSPFYLSRIVQQLQDVSSRDAAQALVSSHSPSVLSRVEPEAVRYFRLDEQSATSAVRTIALPIGEDEAAKYVREAVRTFPELYFARFVILGEGSSEEVVLPRLAEAMELPVDRSFVAVVPLGGRHMNHLWKLLKNLDIPHATLLDLDAGRAGGGMDRIAYAVDELLANKTAEKEVFTEVMTRSDLAARQPGFDRERLKRWCDHLRSLNVYYCWPLDLDLCMLNAFEEEYKELGDGQRGPSTAGDSDLAVLGPGGDIDASDCQHLFSWYRYLFLGKRSKPNTHLRTLSKLSNERLQSAAPEELKELLRSVAGVVESAIPAKDGVIASS